MGKNTNKDILLSITMLVSDRPDTLKKCLASMKPLLDTIPSELIIVDTAGNTECMETARKYTDSIVHFKWRNDFAAARNSFLVEITTTLKQLLISQEIILIKVERPIMIESQFVYPK